MKTDNHIVYYGNVPGVYGKVEKFCKLTLISTETELESTLGTEDVDLLLIAKDTDKTIRTVRNGSIKSDVPILVVGGSYLNKQEKCITSTSTLGSVSNTLSKILKLMSVGKLLNSAKSVQRNI